MTMPHTRPLALAVPLLASKGPEAMSVPQLPEFDEGRCEWWHSPVVIGGTGGSGTRGVVELLVAAMASMCLWERPKDLPAKQRRRRHILHDFLLR